MFTAVFKYAYPHAKVRAMKGLLISEVKYRDMLNADTFEQVIHILQTTSYAESFRGIAPTDLSLQAFSDILYRSLFLDYHKTIRSVDKIARDFLILCYHKYELFNLKMILRGIISHVPADKIATLLLPTDRYTLFSKDALLQCQDVHAVITHLQGTFFQYPLNLALRRFDEEQEFFPLEMALDLYYYNSLWDKLGNLPDADQIIVKEIVGVLLDILNITWIIRFKEHYHFSPEEILNYTIQHGNSLRLKERRSFSEASETASILDLLKATPYGKALTDDVQLNTLHVALSRYFIGRLQKFFSGDPFQMGIIIGYLLLKEFEISDMLTIAEAKRYGFSIEQSRHYVIHTQQG
ncbi:H(+)-transporting two-sector ATPase [Candidatus Moduliflexus flocculans]|uniref:H(+)-transporting two-sector ATPase n=1 Tax=Candidatus Moduliflexus flocculans TaxID=1499966 RepID=A0A081BTD4_9BACT|nr:H(+)-transporting two-sector ATPase [Candidatus Moduliflexus flocculans]